MPSYACVVGHVGHMYIVQTGGIEATLVSVHCQVFAFAFIIKQRRSFAFFSNKVKLKLL